MARYDVYDNAAGNDYLLDVQSDILDAMNTRMIVPLMAAKNAPKPASRLNPVFDINGKRYVMVTQFMAAVPVTILKTPTANFSLHSDQITNALDMLFQGF